MSTNGGVLHMLKLFIKGFPSGSSVDGDMISAAELYGRSAVGVVPPGMRNDEIRKSRQKNKEHWGTVLLQDDAISLILEHE